MNSAGNLRKMDAEIKTVVNYYLPIGDQRIEMNHMLGKTLKLKFTGQINCIATGEKISKSYKGGYSFQSMNTLAECDMCMVKPEYCHFDDGTCRDPEWGKANCFIPHIVYLSVTSSAKIGITRERNVPKRWIDQGATEGLPILRVKDRLTSGVIEAEIAKTMQDKTNWRKMLKGECDEEIDLYSLRDQIYNDFGSLIDEQDAEDLDREIKKIRYPMIGLPEKIVSLNLDKTPEIKGMLLGIKGQYLIFDTGVLNLWKYQGYFVELAS
ncbi:MAG: DUF2797 domain-containing protein [Bacteriovoracaceae bacterium]|jgi:hypothetical protein|nr:DUF2797 domain-containing protein [Bacteriovoracaceae bacterium]